MRSLPIFVSIAFMLVIFANVRADYNITHINTTIILNKNQSAHIIETFTLYVSNSSINTYIQNRDAIGISLSDWQNILYTKLLTEHIISSSHSIYSFNFLPGPLVKSYTGGYALFTMDYYINNITSLSAIAPRQFEYTFNNSVFNFEQTANGEALPDNVRFNIILPSGSKAISIYPLPDSPRPNFIKNYTDIMQFSWYSGEPLSTFSFQFIITESLQEEVVNYFSVFYSTYSQQLYVLVIVLVIAFVLYIVLKYNERHSE